MSAEFSKCYELLGVKPGVSATELKAAYRDMAKVWHPDRFGHDERLQKKAQEKLKEINEAYEALISAKTPRPKPSSSTREPRASNSREHGFDPPRSAYASTSPIASSKHFSWSWVVVPLLVFGVVFLIASRSLLRSPQLVGDTGARESVNSADTSVKSEPATETASEAASHAASRNRNRAEPESQSQTKTVEHPSSQTSAAPLQPMKTVTVLIDPSTGLIARAECPTKTRMTYPAGAEPQGACTAAHASKTQARGDAAESSESRAKSFAKRVVTPSKWLGSGSKD